MATFTPPTAYDNPPILPDSPGLATRLFRYYPNRARYIAVFALSNGTFVQDTPSDENSNKEEEQKEYKEKILIANNNALQKNNVFLQILAFTEQDSNVQIL